jgi:hypothetical protein
LEKIRKNTKSLAQGSPGYYELKKHKSAGISGRKDKINQLTTNSNNKNITDLYKGINECKRGYQLRSN